LVVVLHCVVFIDRVAAWQRVGPLDVNGFAHCLLVT
jgi:hypothetical protein